MPVHAGLQPSRQPDFDPSAAQLVDGVGAQLRPDLGQDPVRRLDQHEPQVGRPDPAVVAGGVPGQVLQLGERLHPGVAAADEDEAERPPAARLVIRRLRHVQAVQHLVTQVDRFFDGLEADPLLGQTRDRQGAGDRAQRDHHGVVVQVVVRPFQRVQPDAAQVPVEADHLGVDHLAAAQHPAQRDHHVPG